MLTTYALIALPLRALEVVSLIGGAVVCAYGALTLLRGDLT